MIIGVISDTHRQYEMIEKAVNELVKSDIIIHLGDNVEDVDKIANYYKGQIINVRGNCDFNQIVPSERIEIIEGKKIFITHGHNYDVKNSLIKLRYKALEIGADVVLFGHTHAAQIIDYDGMYFLNPGSASLSRKGPNSVGIINMKDGHIDIQIKNITN